MTGRGALVTRVCRPDKLVPPWLLSIFLSLFLCGIFQPDRPMAQEAELPHGQQPGGQQAPSSSKILVKNIKVTGNTVISNEELGSVTSSYHGKAMSIEELQDVATLLTDL